MPRIYKVSLYLVDGNDCLENESIDYVKDIVSDAIDRDRRLDVFVKDNLTTVEKSAGFIWDDELPVNKTNCTKEEIDKYFKVSTLHERCKSYGEKIIREPRYDVITGKITHYVDVTHSICCANEERKECDCAGYKYKCPFYPSIRKQAELCEDE